MFRNAFSSAPSARYRAASCTVLPRLRTPPPSPSSSSSSSRLRRSRLGRGRRPVSSSSSSSSSSSHSAAAFVPLAHVVLWSPSVATGSPSSFDHRAGGGTTARFASLGPRRRYRPAGATSRTACRPPRTGNEGEGGGGWAEDGSKQNDAREKGRPQHMRALWVVPTAGVVGGGGIRTIDRRRPTHDRDPTATVWRRRRNVSPRRPCPRRGAVPPRVRRDDRRGPRRRGELERDAKTVGFPRRRAIDPSTARDGISTQRGGSTSISRTRPVPRSVYCRPRASPASAPLLSARPGGSRRPPLEQFEAPRVLVPSVPIPGRRPPAISGSSCATDSQRVEEWNAAVAHPPGPPADRRPWPLSVSGVAGASWACGAL